MSFDARVEKRIEKLRDLVSRRGYDAVIIRNNADLRWLTGAVGSFDSEVAHTAFVTGDGLWLHTDSRYYGTLVERMGPGSPWVIDMDMVDGASWAAQRVYETRSRVVAVEDGLSLSFFDAFGRECAARSVACLTPRMHDDIAERLRVVKDDEELTNLRRAQEITDDAFEHIVGFIRPGLTEQQIRAELEGYMLGHGADALSFDTIVASGPNGANPHARPSGRVVREGDMIVLDYGACYNDYHADMTRTVCLGAPSAQQREVYDIVRRANETCAAAIRPGVIGRDIHNLAVKVISEAGYGDYFKHGLGHGVGLEIHERPNFGRGYAKPCPEGSVVTDEPGIYLPGNFGVRLEDCGIITQEGYVPFGRSPHELCVIDC